MRDKINVTKGYLFIIISSVINKLKWHACYIALDGINYAVWAPTVQLMKESLAIHAWLFKLIWLAVLKI